MRHIIRKKTDLLVASIAMVMAATGSISAAENQGSSMNVQPAVAPQIFDQAKKNSNWKFAFITGEHEQVVFMNVSPLTNPNNEIGLEVHTFDQVILIVEGAGKAILNGKTTAVKSGDMIFIPQGTPHNVVNSGGQKELKLISFYSDTDIPNGAIYKKMIDEPKE